MRMNRLIAVAAALLASSPAMGTAATATAQAVTAKDSAHFFDPRVKAARDDVQIYLKRGSTSGYAKRGGAIWFAAETALVKTVPVPVAHGIRISGPATVVAGQSIQFTGVVYDDAGATLSLPIVWASAPLTNATISSGGLLTSRQPGSVTVSASTPSAPSATRSVAVTVTPAPTPVPPDTTKPPVPPDTTTPVPPPVTIAGATVATLPLKVPITPYPMGGNVVKVPAGASLQAAIDAARAGDVLALAPCATWVGNFTLRNRGAADTGWVVIRTDASDAAIGAEGTRMTPTRAASACLAKILTAQGGAGAAIGTAPGARGWRLTGLEISATSASQNLNTFVRLGESGSGGQTTIASQPYNLVIDRSYVHGNATLNVRRCVIMNSGATEIVDSWLGECHDSGGDSQTTLTYNGTGPHRIENNHLESGHQCFMSGGSDPSIPNLVPSDITFRRNHCYRPLAWLTLPNGAGGWQTKTIIETKNVRRLLIEGNIIENVRADAQAGFAFLLKSENQNCTAPWTQTSDVTVRYNIVRNMGSGVNLAGHPGSCDVIPAARFYFSDNTFENLNVPPFKGEAITLQLLGGGLSDVIIEHNSWLNANVAASSVVFDGGPTARLVDRSNLFPHGVYGVKGAGTADGNGTLAVFAPGAVFTFNAIYAGGGSCSQYPATNVCPVTVPPTPAMGADGRPMGADMARIIAATAGVDVAP